MMTKLRSDVWFFLFFICHSQLLANLFSWTKTRPAILSPVLRMQAGEDLHLTDGKGWLLTASITDAHKKKCTVSIKKQQFTERIVNPVAIGISLLKNVSRLEWFLEKATELGVAEIMPLICQRTEKQHFRFDRMQQILVSAMLQSQQLWLPVLHEPQPFIQVVMISRPIRKSGSLIVSIRKKAHYARNIRMATVNCSLLGRKGILHLGKLNWHLHTSSGPVALGDTRLRTETAGIGRRCIVMCPLILPCQCHCILLLYPLRFYQAQARVVQQVSRRFVFSWSCSAIQPRMRKPFQSKYSF